MKVFLLLVLFCFTSVIFAQDTITSSKANDYLDKVVWLKGKIVSFKIASEGKSTNFINIDKPYPKNIFTVVVTNKYLEEHNINLSQSKGKQILVKGKITTYEKDPKKIPQIFNPLEIEIK